MSMHPFIHAGAGVHCIHARTHPGSQQNGNVSADMQHTIPAQIERPTLIMHGDALKGSSLPALGMADRASSACAENRLYLSITIARRSFWVQAHPYPSNGHAVSDAEMWCIHTHGHCARTCTRGLFATSTRDDHGDRAHVRKMATQHQERCSSVTNRIEGVLYWGEHPRWAWQCS